MMPGLAWDERVLRFDLYAGDKDDGGLRLLSNRIVTARKATACGICWEAIVPGTRIRCETGVMDGRIRAARTCHACCNAIAQADEDNGAALEHRYSIGWNARRATDEPDLLASQPDGDGGK